MAPARLELVRRAASTHSTAGLAAALAAVFALASFLPLWHTDVWGHLSYGRWIVETRSLPETEPLLPLCEGVRFIDTAWLSDHSLIAVALDEERKQWETVGMSFEVVET